MIEDKPAYWLAAIAEMLKDYERLRSADGQIRTMCLERPFGLFSLTRKALLTICKQAPVRAFLLHARHANKLAHESLLDADSMQCGHHGFVKPHVRGYASKVSREFI